LKILEKDSSRSIGEENIDLRRKKETLANRAPIHGGVACYQLGVGKEERRNSEGGLSKGEKNGKVRRAVLMGRHREGGYVLALGTYGSRNNQGKPLYANGREWGSLSMEKGRTSEHKTQKKHKTKKSKMQPTRKRESILLTADTRGGGRFGDKKLNFEYC